MLNIEDGGGHSNTYLVILSIGANILAHFTQANLSFIASIIAILGGTLAIINYCLIFYDRFIKKTKK